MFAYGVLRGRASPTHRAVPSGWGSLGIGASENGRVTEVGALALVVVAAALAVVATATTLRWACAVAAATVAVYGAVVRTPEGVLGAAFVALLAVLVGTVVRQRREGEAQRLTAAVEAEVQLELARELHDVLGHSLSALALQIERSRVQADRAGQVEIATDLAAAHATARRGLDEARSAVTALRSSSDPESGLRQVVADHETATGSPAALVLDGDPARCSGAARLAAHRVVREALVNVRRHGSPDPGTEVAVSWGAPVRVRVTSPLVGDRPSDQGPLGPGAGVGLVGLAERLAPLGASIEAGPQGETWVIEAVIP